ncbi:MAG: hypothetical protein ACC661_02495 [Verrucomicrobiales bacterium]
MTEWESFLRALKRLGPDKAIMVVPVSIKATHMEDRRERVREMVDCLTREVGAPLEGEENLLAKLKRIGVAALLGENPTLDRFAETAQKLLEDTYSECAPPVGPRHAIVQFNPAIRLPEFLEDFSKRAWPLLGELTAIFEAGVQAGLDEINAGNPYPGGEQF